MTAPKPAGPSRSATTVLIVDDEHQAVKYFARLFGAEFDVLTCTSADEAEALFEARQGQIAIIVCDHRMPLRSGVELLSVIKDRWPKTVRLLTTAFADTDSLAASINTARVHRYVAKPWDLDELRDALGEASAFYMRTQNGAATKPSELPSLAGVVAHELASPLLSIELTAQSLVSAAEGYVAEDAAADAKPDARVQRFLRAAQRINEDAARARRLVRALADLARNTATGGLTRISMRTCVEQAVTSFPYVGMEKKRVSINVADDFTFLGSEALMSAVLTNLLSNGLDAIREDSAARIDILIMPGKNYNSVFVTDTGSGVPAAIAEDVFRPFVTSKKNGTGLGLVICEWIVRSFGGTIKLHSRQAIATQVEIQLPKPTPQATPGARSPGR